MSVPDPFTPGSGSGEALPPRPTRHGMLHRAGAVLWPSFVASAIASGVFFANIDPETLRAATAPGWDIGREAGYTIGFFMFWGVTTLSSVFTMILMDRPRAAPAPGPSP